ncbi:MAG: HlyD family efflux transporter periplasmic adaptor subunit [Planctomycetota bacterium]
MTDRMDENVTAASATGLLCLLLSLPALFSGCSGGDPPKTTEPRRGTLQESFKEPAKTRLSLLLPVTMPIDGRIGPIGLEPGEKVAKGQELVAFDRVDVEQELAESRAAVAEIEASLRLNEYNELERTLLTETHAVIDAATKVLQASELQVEAEQARKERAEKEVKRLGELAEEQSITSTRYDDAVLEAETTLIALRKEEFNLAASNALHTAIKLGPTYVEQWLGRKGLEKDELVERLAQAQARLVRAEHRNRLARVEAPGDGIVLERYTRGNGALPAGAELLLLGDLDTMEVVADVLTQDALRLAPGVRVELETPGFKEPLQGVVSRIEPSAFTKLSSLGIEQQRVNVIIGLEHRPETLGVGYRLQARFLTRVSENALIVPRSSVLQAPDDSYYVFVTVNGKPSRRTVELGLNSDLELEITSGLKESDAILVAPDATMQ